MAESALVIVVAEAEPAVAEHRLRHDPVAAGGVPAHITVLFPFRAEVDSGTDAAISEIARSTEPFAVRFSSIERFPGIVLYLAPTPSAPIRGLTRRLAGSFPDCPPYGGAISDPTPHLTIGLDLEEAVADRIADDVRSHLPLETQVDRLSLLVGVDDRWHVEREWMLGER